VHEPKLVRVRLKGLAVADVDALSGGRLAAVGVGRTKHLGRYERDDRCEPPSELAAR
jgi:hypothetical protein